MDDPNVTHLRLRNWARWASDKPLPDLTARISAIYSWAVAHTWSSGWGDDTPGDGIIPIYEQDAELVDKAIRNLSLRHRTIPPAPIPAPVPGRPDAGRCCRAGAG